MKLSFRQVHLDFHTSEYIAGIGSGFSKEQFQSALKAGHASSITIFSKCHHGLSYHPTKIGKMHPNLSFDLLGAQIEAAHEIGVKTPVYISTGFDEYALKNHPEWRGFQKNSNGELVYKDPTTPGYRNVCLNSPYVDYLMAQLKEVCESYDVDGIFLDITHETPCYCQNCINTMIERGWDPRDNEKALELAKEVYARYTTRARETIDSVKPGLPLFHNSGHIFIGRRDLAHTNTHLELESLPTGGWGYDHFPISASYARTIGMEYLGMTGKFHTSWGEFGGFKHKNALRYEAALSIAFGAKCSIGDQLHPSAEMNPATYSLIGAAYKEVEEKEKWCDDVTAVTDIAVLAFESFSQEYNHPGNKAEVGATRMLLEGHYLFDVVDDMCNFNNYKVLILPDAIPLTENLKIRLDSFVKNGGKILASGDSLVDFQTGSIPYSLGCKNVKKSDVLPAYVKPLVKLENMENSSYVIYFEGNAAELSADGKELALREKSYFNRSIMHFSSHMHTPNSGEIEGSAITIGKDGAYISWQLFREYAKYGSLILRDLFKATLDELLGDKKTLNTNLPSLGITTLMDQKNENRLVSHLLYATPKKRGGGIEIIEDIVPIFNIDVNFHTDKRIKKAYLAPQMVDIQFTQDENGRVFFNVEKIDNHQMVVFDY